ncbi:Protein of unknown function [Gryllus bimaculatus]|nr:Protein of unknown function [Gryllus bimaculatus]
MAPAAEREAAATGPEQGATFSRIGTVLRFLALITSFLDLTKPTAYSMLKTGSVFIHYSRILPCKSRDSRETTSDFGEILNTESHMLRRIFCEVVAAYVK